MGPSITQGKGVLYLAKINAVESYLSRLPINFTSIVFGNPDDGSAYSIIRLGVPRQTGPRKVLFSSECIARIQLDMYRMDDKSYSNTASIYYSAKNGATVLAIIEKISKLFGTNMNVLAHEGNAHQDSGILSEAYPEGAYQHVSKLNVFA